MNYDLRFNTKIFYRLQSDKIKIRGDDASYSLINSTCGETFLTSGETFLTSGETFLTCGETFLTSGELFLTREELFLTSGETFLTCGEINSTCGELFLTREELIPTSEEQMNNENVVEKFTEKQEKMVFFSTIIRHCKKLNVRQGQHSFY